MRNIFIRNIIIVVCLCPIAVLFISCTGRVRADVDSGYQIIIGTFAHVVAVAEDSDTAKKCVRGALEEIHRIDDLMSD